MAVRERGQAGVPTLATATVDDGRSVLVTYPSPAEDDVIDHAVAPNGSAGPSFYGDCGADQPA